MLETVLGLAPGALLGVAIVGAGWFGKLTIQNGVPWAVAKLKAWWTAGKAEVASIKSDLVAIESRVTLLESKVAGAKPAAAAPLATAPQVQPAPQTVQQSPNSNG